MKSKLISCIVPVYNGERYLAEALDSILKQTYQPIEIIVVDDGSTDSTQTIAARYDGQIRYVQQDNKGAPAARNSGLNLVQGEFISFLDADDLWHPRKLELQVQRFQARPELDLCVTYLQNFWIPALHEEKVRFESHRLAEPLPGYVTQTLLARTASFKRVGTFNCQLKVGDTLDWFLRAKELGVCTEMIEEVLVYRRMHHENLSMEVGSRRMTLSMHDALLRVVKGSLDRRRGNDPFDPD